ncbi:RusA family crossover junction endodeoxyribonuclease [Heliobacterium chlorum]|uniref:RusA family crossover junction endodeoxyribonuclease n=1 Tax=Heliobacterium chlorum TaxID=2698 RepID=A0ABR7SYM4_HELCL|nr:RusA family crossover junction endodeoxyribonuclease [Heliobacterium chlorum]MBC9783526.1 RusA family crossover junction endodeoxyribonuclease [Heliobacterium chlorum]
MVIHFTVYGEAVAQGRPRATTLGGHVKMFDPEKSANYKTYVRLVAQEHRPQHLLTCPLKVQVDIYKAMPKSLPVYKREAAERGEYWPTTKPDVDNVVKGVMDALTQVIWLDDTQVVELTVRKFYGDPRVEICIETLPEPVAPVKRKKG